PARRGLAGEAGGMGLRARRPIARDAVPFSERAPHQAKVVGTCSVVIGTPCPFPPPAPTVPRIGADPTPPPPPPPPAPPPPRRPRPAGPSSRRPAGPSGGTNAVVGDDRADEMVVGDRRHDRGAGASVSMLEARRRARSVAPGRVRPECLQGRQRPPCSRS